MNDKDLINRIQNLKQVKPCKAWASFTKSEILAGIPEEENYQRIANPLRIHEFVNSELIRKFVGGAMLKPVAITMAAFVFVSASGGTFYIAKNAVPGESFYSLKLTYQNLKAKFSPEEQKPQMHLAYARERVGELNKVDKKKMDEGVSETAKVLAGDFSKAKTTFKNIKEPAKKISAGANLIRQVSEIEKTLAREKEILPEDSREKISEVEKMAKETKEEVLASLIEDPENGGDYRQKIEELRKEIEEYERQYREQHSDIPEK